jgi:hypothetical protein
VIYCDNQRCVKISKNSVFHDRSKQIEIKYYFLCDNVQRGEVVLHYISTNEYIVYILTKPLSKIKFSYLRGYLGLVEIAPLVEREEMTSSVKRELLYVASWIVCEIWICIMLVYLRDGHTT